MTLGFKRNNKPFPRDYASMIFKVYSAVLISERLKRLSQVEDKIVMKEIDYSEQKKGERKKKYEEKIRLFIYIYILYGY